MDCNGTGCKTTSTSENNNRDRKCPTENSSKCCCKFESGSFFHICGYQMEDCSGIEYNMNTKENLDTRPILKEPCFSQPLLQNFGENNSNEIGLWKCSNGHYFHMSRTICPTCKRFPVSKEIDYLAAYDLDDDVFESGDENGPGLKKFGLIKCVKGHIRHKRKEFCKFCPRSQDGNVDVMGQAWSDDFDAFGI